MAEEEDFSKIPLMERAVHKSWKARKSAFEEATKQFSLSASEDDACFDPWDSSMWAKAVGDTNAAAQLDAITALCEYVKQCNVTAVGRTRTSVIPILVEKGLGSAKTTTKQKTAEAILLYIEVDSPGPVIECLIPYFSHKLAKIIAADVGMVRQVFEEFGTKTVDPKPVLKMLHKLFAHTDKNVRAETTALTVELYKWMNKSIMPYFEKDIKPAQLKELEDLFAKTESGNPQPKRLLRSQQEAMKHAEEAGVEFVAEEAVADEPEEEVDPYANFEPVDVLSKIPGNFDEQMGSSKWKDRKDALDEVFKHLSVPKIKDGDYNVLVRAFAKSMKDANVAVVTVAANCTELLAKGIKGGFAKYRSQIMLPIIERLKEKKQSVVDALKGALDAIFLSTSLTECWEDINANLPHKNPNVRLETVRFLTRCLANTKVVPTKAEQKAIVESTTKLLSDTSEPCRTSAAEAMGTLMKIIGERAMTPYLEGLDDIRKGKIKEFFETATVKAKEKPPAPKPAPAPAKKAPAGRPGARPGVKKAPPKAAPPPAAAPPPREPSPPPAPVAAPRPAGRGVPSKLGGPSKLGAPGGLRLQRKPLGGAAEAPPASPKRAAPPPQQHYEEPAPAAAPPPAQKMAFGGRALSSRPLSNNTPAPAAAPIVVSSGLSAMEKAELEELRAEKTRWEMSIEELTSAKNRLTNECNELRNQNSNLIDENTRNTLSIRAKEAQLVRARADAEAAQQALSKLQRENERLKRELQRQVRASSPAPQDISEQIAGLNGGPGHVRDGSVVSTQSSGIRTTDAASKRLSFASNYTNEEKENPGHHLDAPSSNPAPTASSRPTGTGIGVGGRIGVSPNRMASTRSTAGAGAGRTGGGGDIENWKRAAEVTSALKQRIEMMKRQNFGGTR